MQRFLSYFMAVCVALTLSLDAHAKRLGSGKSLGEAPSHQTSQMQPSRTPDNAVAPAQQPGRQQPAPSGASRWLGPLAGIAAGGLLAAMLMGEGFEGIQLLDMLILGLIAFLVFRFIASRKRQAQAGPQPVMAGHGPLYRDVPPAAAPQPSGFASGGAPVFRAPAWFDEQRFLEAAREHFLALQQHWDASEMDKIAEYVTPNLLNALRQERAELGDGYQSTYIENLQIRLDGIDDQADRTVATLTFAGIAKTSRFDQGEPFSESWRMERAQGDNQPWLVAGIRQNG